MERTKGDMSQRFRARLSWLEGMLYKDQPVGLS
ncbi:hypothetical protein DES53_103205 [Roseimicrobium gellanilyticum]|uniref:Uncharacterized protein n=1 Tax=Roseimicrobium gellanilyticum TaxID=748857 RepID=A0A366HNZ1_9BACT|nr:hypothetical protein DES53_103205 [Roseimicrobium gellanilyticum]